MAVVQVRENESFEHAIRKFKKQCEREGIFSEVKKRMCYDKPSVKMKKKAIAAKKKVAKQSRSVSR